MPRREVKRPRRRPAKAKRWPLLIFLVANGRRWGRIAVSGGEGQTARLPAEIRAKAAVMAREVLCVPAGSEIEMELLEVRK